MDTEGRDNPRDVVGGKKMHPWEVFPENEKLSNKKKKNKNRKIIFVIFIILILIGGGIGTYFIIKSLNSENSSQQSPEDEYEPTAYEKAMDTTIEEAQTEEIAFLVCTKTTSEVIKKGYDRKNPSILEDNLQAFLKEQKSEYLKNIYEMCGTVSLLYLLQLDYAEYHLKNIDKLDVNSLDGNQLYAYYLSHSIFYELKGNGEKEKIYRDLFRKKFPEGSQYIGDDEE